MFQGESDTTANMVDTDWTIDQIGDSIIHYELVKNVSHASFMVGKDMSYWNNVMKLLEEYHPLPEKKKP